MSDDTVPPVVPPAAPATPPMPETFSKDYVKGLREENKEWRLKATEMEQQAKTAAEAAKTEAEARIAAAEKAASDRIILAELKASALKAGMIDLDGLKLADISAVKLNDKGELEGADALMESLKTAKPYLFRVVTTTSSTAKAPPAGDGKTTFRDMNPDQQAATLRKMGLPI